MLTLISNNCAKATVKKKKIFPVKGYITMKGQLSFMSKLCNNCIIRSDIYVTFIRTEKNKNYHFISSSNESHYDSWTL